MPQAPPIALGPGYRPILGFYALTLETFDTTASGVRLRIFCHRAGHAIYFGGLSRKRCLASVRRWPASREFPWSRLDDIPEKSRFRECSGREPFALGPRQGRKGTSKISRVRAYNPILMLHVFQKKSKHGIATRQKEIELIRARLRWAERLYTGRTEEG
jgi:hypothetical protein